MHSTVNVLNGAEYFKMHKMLPESWEVGWEVKMVLEWHAHVLHHPQPLSLKVEPRAWIGSPWDSSHCHAHIIIP